MVAQGLEPRQEHRRIVESLGAAEGERFPQVLAAPQAWRGRFLVAEPCRTAQPPGVIGACRAVGEADGDGAAGVDVCVCDVQVQVDRAGRDAHFAGRGMNRCRIRTVLAKEESMVPAGSAIRPRHGERLVRDGKGRHIVSDGPDIKVRSPGPVSHPSSSIEDRPRNGSAGVTQDCRQRTLANPVSGEDGPGQAALPPGQEGSSAVSGQVEIGQKVSGMRPRSTRTASAEVGISASSVVRIARKHGLRPHRRRGGSQ